MRYVVVAWFSCASADGPSARARASSIQIRSGSATTTPRDTNSRISRAIIAASSVCSRVGMGAAVATKRGRPLGPSARGLDYSHGKKYPGLRPHSLGSKLLAPPIDQATALGARQMIAVIGDSANEGSTRLHARFGFRMIGTIEAVGFKHGRWVDSVLMQRALGEGAGTLPERRADGA